MLGMRKEIRALVARPESATDLQLRQSLTEIPDEKFLKSAGLGLAGLAGVLVIGTVLVHAVRVR